MKKLLFIPLFLLASFALVLPTSQPARANDQAFGPLVVQVVTPTATITPTVVVTVTVIVTVTTTPEPTVIPTATVTPSPTPTATLPPTPQPDPLPDGAPLVLAPIESEFLTLWPEIVLSQIDFYYTSGGTFQGLLTHSTIPTGGNPTAPDMVFSHPVDQPAAWIDFVDLPDQMSYALRLDTYEAGDGRGFIARLFVNIEGQVWTRAIDYGNQNRDEAWHVLD